MVITRATPLVAAGINRQKRRAVLCAFGNGERASAGKGALTSVGQETVSIHYPAGRPLPDPARWATGGGKMTPLGMAGGSHPGQAPGASGLCCSLHSPSFPPGPPVGSFTRILLVRQSPAQGAWRAWRPRCSCFRCGVEGRKPTFEFSTALGVHNTRRKQRFLPRGTWK